LFEFSGHYPTTGAALSGRWGDRKWLENTIDAAGMKENSVALLGKLDTPELWFGICDAFLFILIAKLRSCTVGGGGKRTTNRSFSM